MSEEVKNQLGRPTKYKPEYCQQLIDYMTQEGEVVCKAVVVDKEVVDHKLGALPNFFEGFAAQIGVTTGTLAVWREQHPEFLEAYKKAKDIQLDKMLKGSIGGVYNSAGAIFALKNMFGWRDKQEVDMNGTLNLNFDKDDEEA